MKPPAPVTRTLELMTPLSTQNSVGCVHQTFSAGFRWSSATGIVIRHRFEVRFPEDAPPIQNHWTRKRPAQMSGAKRLELLPRSRDGEHRNLGRASLHGTREHDVTVQSAAGVFHSH